MREGRKETIEFMFASSLPLGCHFQFCLMFFFFFIHPFPAQNTLRTQILETSRRSRSGSKNSLSGQGVVLGS